MESRRSNEKDQSSPQQNIPPPARYLLCSVSVLFFFSFIQFALEWSTMFFVMPVVVTRRHSTFFANVLGIMF